MYVMMTSMNCHTMVNTFKTSKKHSKIPEKKLYLI